MKIFSKIFRIGLISLIAILVFLTTVNAQTQSPSPHWPSALASGYLYGAGGMSDSEKRQVYDWAARHYDFIASVDGYYLDYLRSINPTIGGLGRYEIFSAVIDGTSKEQAIENQAELLGKDVEDAYLHYNRDKVSSLRASYDVSTLYPWLRTEYDPVAKNYKVYVPGWDPANDRNGDGYIDDEEFASLLNPNATARRKMYARTVEWTWGPSPNGPQWQTNRGAFDIVKILVDLVEDDLNEPATWGQVSNYSLMWWDVVSGWLYTDDTLEYQPGKTGLDKYRSDTAKLIEYSKQKYGSRLLVGGNSAKGSWVIDQFLDVSIRENFFNTWDTARDWEGTLPGYYYGPFNPNSAYYLSRQANKIQLLQHQYNLRYYIADTPEVWARDRIFGVSAYYLLQNPGKDYWAAWSSNWYWPSMENNQKYWSHALEVDIGQPTDKVPDGVDAPNITYWGVWVFAEGADPGHPDYPDISKSRYKIYARDYTKCLVLLKPKSGNNPSISTFADNTATIHNLPVTSDNQSGRYFFVNDDGSIGSTPLTNITLRNGEAAILIKESALQENTEPPTKPPTIEEEEFASDLSRVKAYPNPYRGDKHSQIIFDNLTSNVRIKIYTLTGELVREIGEQKGDKAYWDVKNKDGESVSSGTYIYYITNPKGEEKKGKVAIIK